MSEAEVLPRPMTVEAFLAWPGDGSGRKFQLIDGVPIAMNPPSWPHTVIAGRLVRLLGNHLVEKGLPCEVAVGPGVQPRGNARRNVRIPDVAVSCAPVRGPLMLEPVVVAEILSPSNASETREAVRNYLTIPSVREVLVVHSTTQGAELLRRQPDGHWPADPLPLGEGDTLTLETFGFSCPLAELYPR